MEKNHPIANLMSSTMEKIREMIDVNTIIGTPIHTPDGITLIPVSKASFGFASAGNELSNKAAKTENNSSFAGGGGAGVKIDPVAFLIVHGDQVKLLPMSQGAGSPVERALDLVPEMFDKITEYIDKNKKED